MPWNSDGTRKEYKPKFTSKFNEELAEEYIYADGVEIDFEDYTCNGCGRVHELCKCGEGEE